MWLHRQEISDRKKRWFLKTRSKRKKANKKRYHRWYLKNKEKHKNRTRQWRQNNLERVKAYRRKAIYGLSQKQYDKMLLIQHRKCAVCHKIMKKPFIDHNHGTNKVRELLCGRCNFLIGFAVENIEILRNAIKYLRKHND